MRTTEQNPILFPHLLVFVLVRVKFQQEQQVGRARGAPGSTARARRCASRGGQRRLLWVASAPRACGVLAPTRPCPGTASSWSRRSAKAAPRLAVIDLAKEKIKIKKKKSQGQNGTAGSLLTK